MKKKAAKILLAPEKAFRAPDDVVKDAALTEEEKLAVLRNWEDDEKALLRADDENMAGQEGEEKSAPPADRLARIKDAESRLSCKE